MLRRNGPVAKSVESVLRLEAVQTLLSVYGVADKVSDLRTGLQHRILCLYTLRGAVKIRHMILFHSCVTQSVFVQQVVTAICK